MKTSILLAVLVGVAVATSNQQWPTFRPGKEYRYELDSQALTGDPHLSTQFSGFRIHTQITLQIQRGNMASLQCSNVRFYQLNDILSELPTQRLVQSEKWQPVDQHLQQIYDECLQQQIQFIYEQGIVRRLQVEADEPEFCINLKKGIVSLFQYDLTQQKQIPDIEDPVLADIVQQNQMSYSQNYDKTYRVMEESVDGECETFYITQEPSELSKLPVDNQEMRVTKIRNYNNCRMRPIYEEGILSTLVSDMDYNRNLTGLRSFCHSNASIIGDRSDFVIREVKQLSRQMYTPLAEENGEIASFSVQELKLQDAQDNPSSLPKLRNPRVLPEGLKISLSQDDLQTDLRRPSRRSSKDTQKTIEVLVSDYVKQTTTYVSKEALTTLQKLMYVLRESTSEDIITVVRNLQQRKSQPDAKKQLKTLIDVIPTCGRPHILPVIMEMIQDSIVTPSEAATMFNMLTLTLKPTIAVLNYLLPSSELFRLPTVRDNCQLRQSIIMSLGTFQHALRQAQNEQPIPDTDYSQIMQKVQDELEQYFKDTSNECDRIAVLKAIGNSGIPQYINFIERYISNQESVSRDVRMNAIFALRRMPQEFAQKINSILLPVYLDQNNEPDVRCVSYLATIKSKPDYTTVQEIVHSLKQENSRKVGAFVYNHLVDIVDSSRLSMEQLRKYVLAAMKEARPILSERFYRSTISLDYLVKDLGIGQYWDFYVLESQQSVYPSSIVGIFGQTLNAKERGVLEGGVDFTGIEELINRLIGPKSLLNNDEQLLNDVTDILKDLLNSQQSNAQQKLDSLIRKLVQKLGLNEEANKDGRFSAYLKVLQNELRFFKVEKANLEDFLKKYSQEVFDFIRARIDELRSGINPDYLQTMSTESTLVIPTQLGIPLYCNITYNHILRLQGSSKLSLINGGYQFDVDVKPSSAVQVEGSMGLQLPLLRSGVNVQALLKLHSHHPLTVEINNSEQNSIVNVKHYMPREQIETIRFESVPTTYIQVIDSELSGKVYVIQEKEIQNKKLAKPVPFQFNYQVDAIDMELQHSWNLPAGIVSFTPVRPFNGRHMYTCQIKPTRSAQQKQYVDFYFHYSLNNQQSTNYQEYNSHYRSGSRSQEQIYGQQQQMQYVEKDQQIGEDATKRVLMTTIQTKNTRQEIQVENQLTLYVDGDYNCQINYLASNKKSAAKITSNVFVALKKVIQPQPNEKSRQKVATFDVEYINKKSEKSYCSFQIYTDENGLPVEVPVEPLVNYKLRQLIDYFSTEEAQSSIYSLFRSHDQSIQNVRRVTTTMGQEELKNTYRYDIAINYQLPQSVQDIVQYFFENFYYRNEWYVSSTPRQSSHSVQREQGQMTVTATVLPRFERLHLVLKTQNDEIIFYVPARFPTYLKRSLTMDSQLLSFTEQQSSIHQSDIYGLKAQCIIQNLQGEKPYVKTFDGAILSLQQKLSEDCEIVLSEDINNRLFTITMQNKRGQKKVMIYLPEQQEIELTETESWMSSNYDVSINGQSVNLVEQEPTLVNVNVNDRQVPVIVKKMQSEVLIGLEELGISVSLSQKQIRIQSHSLHSGELRGVCGDYNGDTHREMTGAQQKLHTNVMDYVLSYAKNPAQCYEY